MKKGIAFQIKIIALLALLCLSIPSFRVKTRTLESASVLVNAHNKAFSRGEFLQYRIHYGIIDAGTATIKITEENKLINQRPTYHIVGEGKSNRFFDFFFKVRDRYESYVDQEAILPWKFIRRTDEGGFKITQDYSFDHYTATVNNGKGHTFEVPNNIQDMISAFYHARTLNIRNAKMGDIYELPAFLDDEIWNLKIKFIGKQVVKTDAGSFRCLTFVPIVQQGRIFKDQEDLKVWISDDENKIPVLAQAEILVGSIKMDLTGYQGLANPVSIVED